MKLELKCNRHLSGYEIIIKTTSSNCVYKICVLQFSFIPLPISLTELCNSLILRCLWFFLREISDSQRFSISLKSYNL